MMEGKPDLKTSRLPLPGLGTLAVVLVSLALIQAFVGRLDLLRGRDLVGINTADARALVSATGMTSEEAERTVELRSRFGTVESVPLFLRWAGRQHPPLVLEPDVRSKLACRTPGQAVRRFVLALALLAAAWPGWVFLASRLRLEYDRLPLLLAYTLTGMGAALQYSLHDPLRERSLYSNHVVFLLLAMVVCAVSLKRDWIRHLGRYPALAFLLSVLALLGLMVGGSGFGAARINLFGFQPIEGVKLACGISLAGYLAVRAPHLAQLGSWRGPLRLPRKTDTVPLLMLVGIAVLGPALVGDFGPVLICALLAVALLWAVTGRFLFVAVGVAAILLSGSFVYTLNKALPSGLSIMGHPIPTGSSFPKRVDMCLSPWANDHGQGMQLGQALWAVTTNGLIGSGVGLSSAREVPLAQSDLAFSAVCEELGFLGAILVLTAYGVMVSRIFGLSFRCPDTRARFLRQAWAILLAVQAIVIVSGTLGLLPLTGVNLPFVSAGGSALLAFWVAVASASSTAGLSASAVPENALLGRARGRQAGLCRVLALLMLLILPARVVWLQWIRSDAVAAMSIRTPDGDSVVRGHANPRLEAMLRGVVRGSIYDRKGRILATSRLGQKQRLGALAKGRFYPLGSDAYHLIGHNDPIAGGPVRLEREYDALLSGSGDPRQALSAYRLKDLPFAGPRPRSADLRLTVDRDLQLAVGRALSDGLERLRAETNRRLFKGAAVVLDVKTGSILASVSRPALDPNSLSASAGGETAQDREWAVQWDRASQGRYPPGSVFKLVTAAAALEAGDAPVLTCAPGLSAKSISCAVPHGAVTLDDALVVSCNRYFSQLGATVGAERLTSAARKLGITRLPSTDVVASDIQATAIGQGELGVSPVSMARMAAAMAAEGRLPPPASAVTGAGAQSAQAISRSVAERIARDMREVVRTGTASGIFGDLPFPVAGKTGSAETPRGDGVAHAWLVGFAPADRPRVAFAVIVENGGAGRSAAAPIARDILRSLPEDLR